jgi:hypothetical protein
MRDIVVDKILKRKNEKQVDAEIKKLKNAIKVRFDLDNFNIPVAEDCIYFMQELIDYTAARSIMKSPRYKAYASDGKKGMFSEFEY